jgi:hypothetical protein
VSCRHSLAETTVSTTNWAELSALATLLCRSQRGKKVSTFMSISKIETAIEQSSGKRHAAVS